MTRIQLTATAVSALATALQIAADRGARAIESDDICLAILRLRRGSARDLLAALKLDPAALETALELPGESVSAPREEPGLPYSRKAKRLMEVASQEAHMLGDEQVGTIHILLAFAMGQSQADVATSRLPIDAARIAARSLTERVLEP